jgi:cytoskeletal protein CcmA (bactofilin family)
VRGDGKVGAALSMARDSAWEGEIHARHAVIAGAITGKLIVAEKLEIGSSAVLRADVVARSIAIAKGAVVEGVMQVTSGKPIVNFEEKRGAVLTARIRRRACPSAARRSCVRPSSAAPDPPESRSVPRGA